MGDLSLMLHCIADCSHELLNYYKERESGRWIYSFIHLFSDYNKQGQAYGDLIIGLLLANSGALEVRHTGCYHISQV
jgi:hypothetical protein